MTPEIEKQIVSLIEAAKQADKEDFLKHYRAKAAALRRKIKATTARKAGHEAAILG